MDDLRFNITNDMEDIIIQVLVINQLLDNDLVDKLERKKLEEEKRELANKFITEFKKNNKEEIKKYNKIKSAVE